MKDSNIYKKILEVAETFIQTKGYNAFSYRDIAKLVGIKTSSIHYYFPTKADLGQAVVKQHVEALYEDLEKVLGNPKLTCGKKLDLFFDGIFAKTYHANRRMCLGGMLASDVLTLPENVQEEVRIFFKKVEIWLEQLLLLGKQQNEFHYGKSVKEEVQLILSLLEGALLLARLYQDDKRLGTARKQVKKRLLKA
jgi:TetR/AcrR family transcriptional regulator, transcriptional repressor for nem operon